MMENKEFIQNISTLKAENEKLIADLKCELEKSAKVKNSLNPNDSSHFNVLSMKNAKLTSSIEKLYAIKEEQAESLKKTEAIASYLAGSNDALKKSVEQLESKLQYLEMKEKMHHQQTTDEKWKENRDCVKMINDVKKKQWCATCGMPGGRFYCSSQCEQFYM